MLTLSESVWKKLIDKASSCSEADSVVIQAIGEAQPQELEALLAELFDEFTGLDNDGGGELGTRLRLQWIARAIGFDENTATKLGINYRDFQASVFHG